MKAYVALLLATCIPISAADRFSRIGVSSTKDTSKPNTTRGYSIAMQSDAIRKEGEKLHDLRPLFAWIQAGQKTPGNVEFAARNPLPEWLPVRGKVAQIVSEGVLLETGKDVVILRRCPLVEKLADGDSIEAVALSSGTFRYTSVGGAVRTVPAYDYGALPTAAELAEINRKSAEAAAAQRAAVKAELDKKVAAAKERAEKAKADREKKP